MHWDVWNKNTNPFGDTSSPDSGKVIFLRAERTSTMDDAIALAERLQAVHEAELGVCERHCEVVQRLASENEALNALVEALVKKHNALRYPGPTDVAGHLEVAEASQAVDAAHARLQEVRNANN